MTVRHPPPRATTGDAWDILGSYRRRLVLAVVSERDGGIHRTALARHVVASEAERPVDAVTQAEWRAVEIRLHHVDLPRLAAAGLVHYDAEDGHVESDDPPWRGANGSRCPSSRRSESGTATSSRGRAGDDSLGVSRRGAVRQAGARDADHARGYASRLSTSAAV
ncbi:DUF7344 domain-containing protein [Haloarcula regularis]|uniref:DUF7344 domain-containing protein n=1 Tax=Haloarcula regularis TaxID=3033392 RepID=UPI0023E78C54|nr:hypothetical protein [Halomicroarcula sp. SYNS111]